MEQLFAQKVKKFWEDEIMKLPESWQKVGEQNSYSGEVIGENENCVFYLYFKTQRTFWPTQYK